MMFKEKLKKFPLAVKANAVIKTYLDEYKAARSLAYYQHEARQRHITCLEGRVLQEALRERLMSRAAGRWPKPKGELHIFLAYYISNWGGVPKVLLIV